MSTDTQSERLRAYLRTLSPAVQSALFAEIDRKSLTGEGFPDAKLIQAGLRSELRDAQMRSARIGNPSRLFFASVEAFLVDDAREDNSSQIARASLAPIWAWICRDLLPESAKRYSETARRELLENRSVLTELVQEFRQQVFARAGQELATTSGRERALEQLLVFGATPRVLDDLRRVLAVLIPDRHR